MWPELFKLRGIAETKPNNKSICSTLSDCLGSSTNRRVFIRNPLKFGRSHYREACGGEKTIPVGPRRQRTMDASSRRSYKGAGQ